MNIPKYLSEGPIFLRILCAVEYADKTFLPKKRSSGKNGLCNPRRQLFPGGLFLFSWNAEV